MNWNKIYALSLRHIYLIRIFSRILDLIYWPTIQIFLWVLFQIFYNELELLQ